MKSKHDIREYQCVACEATFTGYREDAMTVYSTVENEHRPERLHVSGCPACGCDDCMEVDTTEPDDDNGYGDDLDGVAVEAVGVGTKSGESAGTSCTSTPSEEQLSYGLPPSPRYYEVVIQPCASGFGEWAPSEANGEAWDDIDNLESEIRASVDVLEWAELEGTDEDIRGRIHRQSELIQIFAWLDDDGRICYSGIVEG